MFENKLVEGIYYSRFVASWFNANGGKLRRTAFRTWLNQLVINGRHLTEDEVREIYDFATNGKLELESNAIQFMISVKES